jgi:hypothetical protein
MTVGNIPAKNAEQLLLSSIIDLALISLRLPHRCSGLSIIFV